MQLETTNKYNPNLTILIPKSSQDPYFERMLSDLKSGLHYIFKGNNHVLPEYRQLHIHMETHLKNDDLKKGSDGTTVLHVVSEEGYEDYIFSCHDVQKLVRKTDLKSVLHVACENNYLQIVELILRNNANLNEMDTHGNTPLHLACKQGHVEIVDLLLAYKASVDISDYKGKTPLYVAVNEKNIEIVKAFWRIMQTLTSTLMMLNFRFTVLVNTDP
ncbi:DAPK [Mytilus edulis]|uniref:DAPK n=1 Tax=Mytilus edulis TaxID=6550 RepID=A0A8S3TIF8_MYTED|nr:DAPK [Mytilus edulis]